MFASGSEFLHALRTSPEDAWVRDGETRALALFHAAAERVPAYKDFLQKQGVRHEIVRTMDDFQRGVPVLDKESYVLQYPLSAVCWDGVLSAGAWIAQSSGTTGEPMYWPRFAVQSKESALVHEALFREWYDTADTPALFVVCFHLGSHIAGMVTAAAIHDLFRAGHPGALITPGLNQDDILRSVRRLGASFQQVILIGYPPFIKDVIIAGSKAGISWGALNTRLLFAAESFPESWRAYMMDAVGAEGSSLAMNVYGSADMGFMAHETGDTIDLRRRMHADIALQKMFGAFGGYMPPIFQYHPHYRFMEIVRGEIVCTADAGIPFVRYNMHDRGALGLWRDLPDASSLSPRWQLPMISVLGRSNHSATIYGLNVYPEHIRDILASKEMIRCVSGKFFLKTSYDDEKNQILELHIERLNDTKQPPMPAEQLTKIVVRMLCGMNDEYAKLLDAMGARVWPKVFLYDRGSVEFHARTAKHRYIVHDT